MWRTSNKAKQNATEASGLLWNLQPNRTTRRQDSDKVRPLRIFGLVQEGFRRSVPNGSLKKVIGIWIVFG